jgi:hypothetical protein
VIDDYEWAYDNEITTIDSFALADPDWYVKRWHMAKMVVNYAVNVLWKVEPQYLPAKCIFNDRNVEWESQEIKTFAQRACALWIMWIRIDKFYPKQLVSRAEFGTVLSRLLWGSEYDIINPSDNTPYYRKHLEALKREWIMTQIDNPW